MVRHTRATAEPVAQEPTPPQPAPQPNPAPAPVALTEMTEAELLAEYNRRSPTKRRARFKSREEAYTRIGELAPVSNPEQRAKREPKAVRARMGEMKIVLLVEDNPYREHSAARAHFEKMRGANGEQLTRRQYLARFEESEQKTANQWLWNAVRAGHAKTVSS